MDNHIKVPVDLKKEDILALDIATHTGYYSTHGSGTWDFTEKKSNDWKQHLDFRTTLLNFIQKNNIRLIAAEDVNVGGRFSGMRKLSEFRGILRYAILLVSQSQSSPMYQPSRSSLPITETLARRR